MTAPKVTMRKSCGTDVFLLDAWKKNCGADATGGYGRHATKPFGSAGVQDASAVKARILEGMREIRTVGWQPACACNAGEPVPCTVIDPFAGSGTTGEVALELGRQTVLIELNPAYVKLIQFSTMRQDASLSAGGLSYKRVLTLSRNRLGSAHG